MRAYFQARRRFDGELLEAVLAAARRGGVAEAEAELRGKRAELYQRRTDELTPLIERAFDEQDDDQRGVLSAVPSQLLFRQFTVELVRWAEAGDADGLHRPMAAMAARGASPEQLEAFAATQRKVFAEMLTAYREDAVGNDMRAFDVLDQDGDGSLVRERFVQALLPDTELNVVLMRAFGLLLFDEQDLSSDTA